MNLSLDGLVWRTVLRAVPESARAEVLGTLNEYYGSSAPAVEAFRTFTSGSRMNNRAGVSSPTDLWREGARNATALLLVSFGTATLARGLLPQRWPSIPSVGLLEAALSFVLLASGVAMQRDRLVRLASLLVLIGCASAIVLSGESKYAARADRTTRVGVAVFILVFGAIMLTVSSLRRTPRRRVVLSTTAVFVGVITLMIRPAPLTYLSQFAAITVGVGCWIFCSHPVKMRVWWPVVLGAVLGISVGLANAAFSNPAIQVAGKLLVLGFYGLAATSVLLVFVRPMLFLTLVFLYLHSATQFLAFARWRPGEWSKPTMVPVLIGATGIGLAVIGSRRALHRE